MTKFESSLYEPPFWKKPSKSSLALAIGLLLVSLGWLFKLAEWPRGYTLIVLGGILIFTHNRFDLRKKPKLGKQLGDFNIDSNGIQILNQLIAYSQINTFRLWYGDYHMKIIYSKYIGYYFHIGTENHFIIELRDGSKISHNFMVWNRNHEKDLVESLKSLYDNQVLVFENGPTGRTFLGEDLSYEELQDFKSRYHLKDLGYKRLS